MNSLTLLTDSACKCFRACPRKYEFAYQRARRPRVTAEPLTFGGAVHRWLESWWGGKGWDRSVTAGDPYLDTKLRAMVTGYAVRWTPVVADAVELEFAVPMVNPATGRESRTWRHAGKVDAIATIDGEQWIVEHKTSSEDISPGSVYWRRLRLDTQVSGYLRAARALGYDPVGVLYDVLGVPQLRPHKATPEDSRKYKKDGSLYANQRDSDETPDEYGARCEAAIAADPDAFYQRGEVVRLEDEAEEAAADLWMTGRAIAEARHLNRFPRNPSSCFQWSRPCDYFDVCTGVTSLDNDLYFQTTADNPELGGSDNT